MLFSLLQKVGGQSCSATEIEFTILKMKNPAHQPQISLMLALHKFRVTEEPLVLFALSSGMFSSPAARIFSAEKVRQSSKNR
ncbi:hypothetical protein ZWY2020_001570 [Hordeum vulgare]|nr:hypothetical protein ZWY2020_001570 [Hordeum vulgare]